MSMDEIGFLSSDLDEVREIVRARYLAWRSLLLRVTARCIGLQHALVVDPMDSRQTIGTALYARTIASTQAAALLLEHGLISQARTLLRAALETLFTLGAIERRPDLVSQVLSSHEADRRTVADRIQRSTDPRLRASAEWGISQTDLELLIASKAKALNHYEMACAADLKDMYLSHYLILSFSAHGKLFDLQSHLITNSSGEIEGMKSEPETEDQESTWAYAIEIQIMAARSVARLFDIATFDNHDEELALVALVAELEG